MIGRALPRPTRPRALKQRCLPPSPAPSSRLARTRLLDPSHVPRRQSPTGAPPAPAAAAVGVPASVSPIDGDLDAAAAAAAAEAAVAAVAAQKQKQQVP